ncbi:MAG: hypothetical protein Q6370_024405, partial [Candidatus Sigynarchaeota archaeon]
MSITCHAIVFEGRAGAKFKRRGRVTSVMARARSGARAAAGLALLAMLAMLAMQSAAMAFGVAMDGHGGRIGAPRAPAGTIGTSADPTDPLLWYRHTNASLGDYGYDVIINGSDLYAVGAYAVNGVDLGLLVTRWTTGGQHVWTRTLNQLTYSDPLDGKEKGWEAWCNGSGDVYVSGTGTALARVSAAGTITSLNVSSYDRLSDLDVNGSCIFAGGGREGSGYYTQYDGYLKKFTLDGQLVWKRVYTLTGNNHTAIRDVAVIGDQIIGLQQIWGTAIKAYFIRWNATGDIMSNASIGDFQAEEMARDGEAFYVVGTHELFKSAAFLVKVLPNGTVAWTRNFGRGDEITCIKDVAIFGDVVYVCGYLWHQ